MQSRHFLTLALLSAAILPVSGVRAQDNDAAGTTGGAANPANTAGAGVGGDAMAATGVQDVTQFREDLQRIRSIFTRIRENRNLALASQDALTASTYTQANMRLQHEALGIFDQVTQNWRRMDTPEGEVQQMGSRDMARFARESDDTAFVRNAIWQLQSQMQGAKLAGREVVVTDEMMTLLDAAIQRAENPNFRVASAYRSRLSEINWNRSEEGNAVAAAAPEEETARTTERREWQEVTIHHDNLPSRNQVAQAEESTMVATPAPAAAEETIATEERVGAADLPRTGGNPALFYLFGSGLMSMGGLLLRRRR